MNAPSQTGGSGEPPTDPKTLTVLAIMFACFTLALAGYGTYEVVVGGQMARWPTTSGTIEEMKYHQHDHHNADLRKYKIRGRVAYQVGGQNLAHRFRFSGRGYGERMSKQYAQGKSVTVHYNPDDPTEASIDPPVVGVGYFLLFLAAIPLGVAIFLFLKARRRRRTWAA